MGELIVNGMKMAFFHIISCCLPFDSNAVFGAIALAINGILAFLIASKIFNLTTNKITV